MNKKLIALAVAGALAAPLAAFADAQIYGQMHMSVEYIDNDVDNVDTDASAAVSSNSSRIGFKGSEDLGNGMSAVWQVETGLQLADKNGGTTWAGRNSFVGLAGGFGTALVGRHDTPYKSVARTVDFFGDTLADSRTIVNDNGQHARPNNVIAYVTPNFSGLQGVLAYVTDLAGDTKDDTERSAYSLALNYNNGPLYVGLATQNLSKHALGSAEDAKAHMLAASYSFGAFKLAGLYQRDQNLLGVDSADRNTFGIGGAFKFGNSAVKAQFYRADEIDDTSDTDANQISVGFDHSLSKQTSVYVLYSRVDNGDNSAINVSDNDNGHGDVGPAGKTDAGGTPAGLALGVVHKF